MSSYVTIHGLQFELDTSDWPDSLAADCAQDLLRDCLHSIGPDAARQLHAQLGAWSRGDLDEPPRLSEEIGTRVLGVVADRYRVDTSSGCNCEIRAESDVQPVDIEQFDRALAVVDMVLREADARLAEDARDDHRIDPMTWTEARLEELRAMAAQSGWRVADVISSRLSASLYVDLTRGESSMRVRISDHRMKHPCGIDVNVAPGSATMDDLRAILAGGNA